MSISRAGRHRKKQTDSTHPTPPDVEPKRRWLQNLGPGLVTGAADDDPSGIATYSQVGAQFGFSMLWTMPFSYPLMCGIQEISGHIGRVTGRGIAGNLRRHYHPALLYSLVLLMVAANIINLGADIGAMGAALRLLIGGPALLYAALFAIGSAVLEANVAYERYSGVLKCMCFALFAYVATVFVVHIPWGRALHATILPTMAMNMACVTSIVAVLGTTISPYLFFWQAQEEVEIEKANPTEHPLTEAPRQAKSQLHRIRVDTYLGMAFSNLVAYFIILTAAATLHMHGITNIQTSTQAAQALRPIAGKFAFLLFTLGIVGTGLLALPVLAGSAAYAVGEAFAWKVGLKKTVSHARPFYAVLAVSMLIGLALNFFHFNPIKALFWSAVINGVVAAPIMILMMLIGQNSKIMGRFTLGRRNRFLGWAATIVMTAASVAMFATWGK